MVIPPPHLLSLGNGLARPPARKPMYLPHVDVVPRHVAVGQYHYHAAAQWAFIPGLVHHPATIQAQQIMAFCVC